MANQEYSDFNIHEFLAVCDRAWEKSGRRAQELFGDKETLPTDELEIVFSSLSHTDKLAKLQVMRGEKAIAPKSFRKRITEADHIYARSLGIKL